MLVERISRLALPRGAKPKCELCGQPAELKSTACSAWFCSANHFKIAWDGVLHLIYRELNLLQETRILIGSERERQEFEKKQKQLAKFIIKTCTTAAQKWVVQGNFGLAVGGALYAARTAETLYGVDSMEIVPSQLLLAEIYLGLHYLHSAEELLIMADFGLAKYPEASLSTRCSLYRNFGRLYASQNKYDQALCACATDVYFAACEFGPMDFRTMPSFFNMAEVFRKSGVAESQFACTALYSKICEIVIAWFEQVKYNSVTPESGYTPSINVTGKNHTRQHIYTDLELQEVTEIMRCVVDYASYPAFKGSRLHGLALCAMGLIYAHADLEKARSCIQKALQICSSVTEKDETLLKKCEAYEKVVKAMQDGLLDGRTNPAQ